MVLIDPLPYMYFLVVFSSILLVSKNIYFKSFQVIQMNKLPLVVTFIGTENCNIGHILSLDVQIESMLEEFKLAVSDP